MLHTQLLRIPGILRRVTAAGIHKNFPGRHAQTHQDSLTYHRFFRIPGQNLTAAQDHRQAQPFLQTGHGQKPAGRKTGQLIPAFHIRHACHGAAA